MPKLIITINQECCRCQTKIQKVLTCLQGEFCIEKIEFEKCSSKVTITGKFDADNLSCRLRCKASKCIKNIEKVEDEKKEEKKKEPTCQLVNVYPWSCPPCPYPYQPPYGACPSSQGSCSSCYPQECKCYCICKPLPCACTKFSRSGGCSGDHHGGGDGCSCGSSCSSKPVPYALPAPLIVCEDNNPSYACSVM